MKKIILLAAAGLILIVIIQNSEAVSLRFLFWKISISGIIFYPILLGLGFLAGWVAARVIKKQF